MTLTNEHVGSSPDPQPYLVLAALADGERVDPIELRAALEDPAAREYLVDLIALRHAVGTLSDQELANGQVRRRLWTRVRWFTAAAALLISLTAGYLAGQRRATQTLPAPMIETAVDLGSIAVAPEPTRVVALRPGINWTEKAGGH